ncbi:MAG: alpha/beta hydrolase [Burkholderiales bacterium]
MSIVTIDGRALEIRTIDACAADHPTLVFLHEGIGSISLWRDFPDRLAAATGFGALVYSRYGYGQSAVLAEPRAADYMHREALDVLPAILQTVGIDRHMLVGHSDGASIALIYAGAAARPGLEGVLLEAPHVFVEPMNIKAIAATRETFMSTDLASRLARHHRDPSKTFYGWNDVWLSPAFRDWNIESHLAGIAVRVLAMQGIDDEYGTMTQLDRIMARVPDCRELRIPRCGHSPHRDQPEVVLAAMTEFIAALLRKR